MLQTGVPIRLPFLHRSTVAQNVDKHSGHNLDRDAACSARDSTDVATLMPTK